MPAAAEEPITAETIPNVENIGGKPNESHEIHGIPITPEVAAQIRSAEAKAGHDTGKGSAAARVQSAAAFNLRENIVPPVGTKDVGTERGVLDGKSQKLQTHVRIDQGTATHASRQV